MKMLTFAPIGSYYYVAPGGNDMRFTANAEILEQMAFGGQIAAQYADCHGFPTKAFPYNPDGSPAILTNDAVFTRPTELVAYWEKRIFLAVFLMMAAVVMASIGRSVWRAANENPAEVVKRE